MNLTYWNILQTKNKQKKANHKIGLLYISNWYCSYSSYNIVILYIASMCVYYSIILSVYTKFFLSIGWCVIGDKLSCKFWMNIFSYVFENPRRSNHNLWILSIICEISLKHRSGSVLVLISNPVQSLQVRFIV